MKVGGIGADIRLSPMILLPPRDWLIERCDRRFDTMMELGAVAEVETLLTRHLHPDLPVMRAIGVPEIAAYLKGDSKMDDVVAKGQLATRQYAKRQYTWFSNQPPPDWPRERRQIDDVIINDLVIKLQQ